MKRLLALLPALWLVLGWFALSAPVPAATGPGLTSGVKVIGRGCSTVYYIDDDCDGCGPGVKSPAQALNLGAGLITYPVEVYWGGTATSVAGSPTLTIVSTSYGYLQAWRSLKISGPGLPGNGTITAFGTYAPQPPYGTGTGTGTVTMSTNAALTEAVPVALVTSDNFGAVPFWTMGDTPDADDTDPTVCTAADWQAKYGWTEPPTAATRAADNAAIRTFLQQRKNFTNTASIYYVDAVNGHDAVYNPVTDQGCESSAAGNNALPNQPDTPCASMAPVLRALQVRTQIFTGSVVLAPNSTAFTVTCSPTPCTGALTWGSKLSATGLPAANEYSIKQTSGGTSATAGINGTYVLAIPALATATTTPVNAVGTNYTGGAVIVRKGTTANINPSQGGNPNWQLGGSAGFPVLLMAYPGEAPNLAPEGAGFVSFGSYTCCGFIDGFLSSSPSYGNSGGFKSAWNADYDIRNSEFAGYDDGIEIDYGRNITIESNVFHENQHHAVYMTWGGSNGTATGSYTAGSNVLTLTTSPPFTNILKVVGAMVCNSVAGQTGSGFPCNGIPSCTAVGQAASGASCITWVTGQTSSTMAGGVLNGTGNYTMNNNATATGTGVTMSISAGAALGAQAANTGGSFSFAKNDVDFLNGAATPAGYNGRVKDNSMYDNGNSGYEPIHINDVHDGPLVTGNISAYSGGAGQAFQTGIYNGRSAGNLFFLEGADCINVYLDKSIEPANSRWNTWENNVCWNNASTDTIRGGSPAGGIVTSNPAPNGPVFFVRDTIVRNNVIVGAYSSSASIGALEFNSYSYPESDVITGNQIYSNAAGNPPTYVMQVQASASATVGAGTYPFSGGSGCTTPAASSLNTCFPGPPANTYGDPGFPSALEANFLNPGAFDFGKYNLVR